MVNSKKKGSAGERELARVLRDTLGIEARRGQQFSGSPDSPDLVTSLDGIHIECKRVERFGLYEALNQSRRDAGEKIPTVFHRKSREEWVAIVEVKNLKRFCEIICSAGKGDPSQSSVEEDVSSLERGNG